MFSEFGTVIDNFFSEGINDIIAGFFVPIIIWLIIKIIKVISEINSYKPYRKFIGKYYYYYYSTSGNGSISKCDFTVKSFLGYIHINSKNFEYEHSGKITFERNTYITLKGKNFNEWVYFILVDSPPVKSVDRIHGVKIAVSSKYEPSASKVIFSRQEISEDELVSEFDDNELFSGGGSYFKALQSNDYFYKHNQS